jgi:tRNA1(Val) A37 N6-methylase TrmN6
MTLWTESELRRDAFLGGRVHVWQPKRGYRAGIDPVLLAASVPARAGQRVLDLGCGAGAATLCLGARVPGLDLTGVERHPGYAALARRNASESPAVAFRVIEADLADLPMPVRAEGFDHVLANPPYYDRRTGSAAPDEAREVALGEETALPVWVDVAARRLRPRGFLHVILKPARLADALLAMAGRLGSIVVQPLASRPGRDASLVILRARKEGRADLRLRAPIQLHEGVAHPGDSEHYTEVVARVLRCGAALEFDR